MAAYTSTKTGLWNDTTVWGGGPPASGDTATVANTHTVTIPDGYTATIGATGQATGYLALTVSSGGKLVIGQGASGELDLQGDFFWNGTVADVVHMNAGSTLRFKPSNAQRIQVQQANNNATATMTVNGTSVANCAILTDATSLAGGGLRGYFSHGAGGGQQGITTCVFCNFTSIDDGNVNYAVFSGSSVAGQNLTWTDNTFSDCGKLFVACNGNNTGAISVQRNRGGYDRSGNALTANIGTAGLGFDIRFNNAKTTGSRNVIGNYFDLSVKLASTQDLTWQSNVVQKTAGTAISLSDGPFASCDSMVFIGANEAYSSAVWTAFGDLTNSYFVFTQANTANPHCINTPTTRSVSITGCIAECVNGSDGQGDFVVIQQPAAPQTVTMKNNIVLPDGGQNNASVCLFTFAGSSLNATLTCEHNTYCAGTQAGDYSEGGNLSAGQIASFKANLPWNPSAPADAQHGYKLLDSSHQASGGTQDVVSPTNADYNGGWNINLANPSAWPANTYTHAGLGYQGNFSALPGAHDVGGTSGANPNFVDRTRNLLAWDTARGGVGTVASAKARLATNPTVNIADLLAYVRAGFRPTNTAYKGASYPGDASTTDAAGNTWPGATPDIGAMAWWAGPIPGTYAAATGEVVISQRHPEARIYGGMPSAGVTPPILRSVLHATPPDESLVFGYPGYKGLLLGGMSSAGVTPPTLRQPIAVMAEDTLSWQRMPEAWLQVGKPNIPVTPPAPRHVVVALTDGGLFAQQRLEVIVLGGHPSQAPAPQPPSAVLVVPAEDVFSRQPVPSWLSPVVILAVPPGPKPPIQIIDIYANVVNLTGQAGG